MARESLSELMVCVAEFAKSRGRIPVGQWTVDLEPGWDLRVNGTDKHWDGLPPWSAIISRGGLPVMLFDPFGGTTLGGPNSESVAIEMLKRLTESASEARP